MKRLVLLATAAVLILIVISAVTAHADKNPLSASAHPNPFDPQVGFIVEISGGAPPYTVTPQSSPPNPPGVEVEPTGNPNVYQVTVMGPLLPGTEVIIDVMDSEWHITSATSSS